MQTSSRISFSRVTCRLRLSVTLSRKRQGTAAIDVQVGCILYFGLKGRFCQRRAKPWVQHRGPGKIIQGFALR